MCKRSRVLGDSIALKWYDSSHGDKSRCDERAPARRDARQRPTKALAEAIWNALDVGANHVDVHFDLTPFEAIKTIVVTDDGEGMSREQASMGFSEYGDSWKRRIEARPRNGRSIHGQRGEGRYDILHLGTAAAWTSVATQIDGQLELIQVELTETMPRTTAYLSHLALTSQ